MRFSFHIEALKMNSSTKSITTTQILWLGIALSIPAFLWNLGSVAFIGDEAIRSLVAFEMKLSGNFIVPTLNGEAYYNKPPLFNWLIYFVSEAFGYYGEWPTRLVSLSFLGLFAYSVYHFTRKEFDQTIATTVTLMLLTSGRILFWDSMVGLIDICFCWIIYLNFMLLYFLGKKGTWFYLFLGSYFLCGVAFMLKGLPALVFQAISIIACLVLFKQFKQQFFKLPHIVGSVLGLFPALCYYVVYASSVSLSKVFSVLLDQSMQRTGTHHGIGKTVLHFFTFPFEQIYHFLPWSLLLVVVIHKKFWYWINSNEFIRFNFWMLVVNLPVYWLSVQVYPRYLLMFVPLFNLCGVYCLLQWETINKKQVLNFKRIFLFAICLVALSISLFPLISQARSISYWWLLWIFGMLFIAFILFFSFKFSPQILLWTCISLLCFRIIFNGIVLPIREKTSNENACKEDCKRISELYGTKKWLIYGQTQTHQVARFYTSVYSNQIIKKTHFTNKPEALYLVDLKLYPGFPGTLVDSLILEKRQIIHLMKTNNR